MPPCLALLLVYMVNFLTTFFPLPVLVTLSGPDFEGFLIQARDAENLDGPTVGSFMLVEQSICQLLTCNHVKVWSVFKWHLKVYGVGCNGIAYPQAKLLSLAMIPLPLLTFILIPEDGSTKLGYDLQMMVWLLAPFPCYSCKNSDI